MSSAVQMVGQSIKAHCLIGEIQNLLAKYDETELSATITYLYQNQTRFGARSTSPHPSNTTPRTQAKSPQLRHQCQEWPTSKGTTPPARAAGTNATPVPPVPPGSTTMRSWPMHLESLAFKPTDSTVPKTCL
ncbi:unnamed protein product [Penicillium bialowiezense]